MLDSGDKLPDLQLPDHDGKTRTLADLTGKKGLVLYVYPKDDTPGCTIEAQDFRDLGAKFQAAGYTVAGLSRDGATSHCKFRDKFSLAFPLLTDADGKFLTAIDAIGEKNMYGKKVHGILRTTFVIGKDGVLQRVYRNVNAKGHAEKVLTALG